LSKRTPTDTLPLIDDPSDLEKVIEEARAGNAIGLDTEFMREKTYRARLCLVQIATRRALYLVDPLTDVDLAPIGALIADEDVEVIVHAGRQDFEIFYEAFGAVPRRVFDVQLAAGFAGYGASLPYGRLVESITRTTLTKGESYTDWCRRPLSDSQLRYAADDVRFLMVIADRLKEELDARGRLGWVVDEMAALESEDLYATDVGEAWKRVSGRGALSGKQAAVLREVARWREETAIRRDIPRGWVVKDQTLVEIARRNPRSGGDLKNVRGLAPKEAERSAAAIVDAVRRGQEAKPLEMPSRPSRSAQARARTLSGLADAIVRSRCDGAGIATELVSTRGELESLLSDVFSGSVDPQKHRLLQGWRRELAGDAVVALAEGRIAVRSVERPPYIEEVPLG
jgi:ribonuclease D